MAKAERAEKSAERAEKEAEKMLKNSGVSENIASESDHSFSL